MIITISTHGGITENVEVEDYNAQEVTKILNGITKNENGNTYNVINLGNNIYSCIDIKSIRVEVEEIGGTN